MRSERTISLLLCSMDEQNAPKKQKDPADIVCPSLWRAKKTALRLVESDDPAVDRRQFEEVAKKMDELGVVVGCRFVRTANLQNKVDTRNDGA